jgi:Ca2+-binding RTX toxin-like protein
MIHRNIARLALIVLGLLTVLSIVYAFAANIVVPVTRHTDQRSPITADTLKPQACSAITLTQIVHCPTGAGGVCDGTNANELILGTANVDVIQGKGGSDCILGGGGDDNITGSQAKDVCIGGPGNDTFKKCETTIQ